MEKITPYRRDLALTDGPTDRQLPEKLLKIVLAYEQQLGVPKELIIAALTQHDGDDLTDAFITNGETNILPLAKRKNWQSPPLEKNIPQEVVVESLKKKKAEITL